MNELYDILIKGGHSCVIRKNGNISCYNQRGVKDLFDIYSTNPSLLNGCDIADKVVGKGAAALMVLSGVKRLFAKVISQEALSLLEKSSIQVDYETLTPYIINRAGNGQCPLETKLKDCKTAEECWNLIVEFVKCISN